MLEQPRAGIGVLVRTLFVPVLVGLALLVWTDGALARGHRHHHGGGRARAALPAGATDPLKDAALIADGATGRLLYSRNAYSERHPASLTKMMTLYLLFEALKRGDVNMQTMLPISEHAASQRPTNLHLYAGDMIPVDTAIKAIVVRSANDVAVAIGEALGGTEGHFAELMTEKARALGMRNTFYHNASGLPDAMQITTASDLLILARHLAYDFPQYFPYFATPAFNFRGTTYVTHDNLIGRYDGADGIKTGYTGSSGFNLVSSVVRGGTHIIGIVMGGRTARRRDQEMVRLLDDAFVQVGRNPALVAHAGVPWRNGAINAPPVIASLDIAPEAGDDEDTAESAAVDDAGDDDTNVIAAAPPPRPNTNVVAFAAPPPAVPVYVPAPAPPPRAVAQPPAVRMAPPDAPMRMSNVPRPTAKPVDVAAADVPVITPKPRDVALATPARQADGQAAPARRHRRRRYRRFGEQHPGHGRPRLDDPDRRLRRPQPGAGPARVLCRAVDGHIGPGGAHRHSVHRRRRPHPLSRPLRSLRGTRGARSVLAPDGARPDLLHRAGVVALS
ncbi:MAG: D-alanyl-D-alanine carboxypeptidase family protein [Rhizomicrobium sp.]